MSAAALGIPSLMDLFSCSGKMRRGTDGKVRLFDGKAKYASSDSTSCCDPPCVDCPDRRPAYYTYTTLGIRMDTRTCVNGNPSATNASIKYDTTYAAPVIVNRTDTVGGQYHRCIWFGVAEWPPAINHAHQFRSFPDCVGAYSSRVMTAAVYRLPGAMRFIIGVFNYRSPLSGDSVIYFDGTAAAEGCDQSVTIYNSIVSPSVAVGSSLLWRRGYGGTVTLTPSS